MMTQQPDMKRHGLVPAVVAALLLSSAGAWAEGAPPQGRAKSAMCEGCHGIAGYRTAYPHVYQVPKLGGQQPDYLIKALHDYNSGARVHPSMRAIAATLSDQDIADLAAYYAGNQVTRGPR